MNIRESILDALDNIEETDDINRIQMSIEEIVTNLRRLGEKRIQDIKSRDIEQQELAVYKKLYMNFNDDNELHAELAWENMINARQCNQLKSATNINRELCLEILYHAGAYARRVVM